MCDNLMQFFQPPKYKKKKKFHKQFVTGQESKPHLLELTTGFAGLKAMENGRITPKQLETIRRVITRQIPKYGETLFHVFPNIAITKKPKEVRMGKGKGAVKLWISNVKQGKIIVEFSRIELDIAKKVLKTIASKMPIKTIAVYQNNEFLPKKSDKSL